jgi:hypothetical protein
MDFNDIQSAWNNDKSDHVVLPTNLEKIQSTKTPVDKIRKNLKHEFYLQLLAVVLIGFFPKLLKFDISMIVGFYVSYAVFVAISIYYFVKLYLFYKRLSSASVNTKDNLYEIYFDIKLNMELYKSFSYSLLPFVLIFQGMYLFSRFSSLGEKIISAGVIDYLFLFIVLGGFVISVLLTGILTEYWVNYYYGKYAKQIRKVLDELKEE